MRERVSAFSDDRTSRHEQQCPPGVHVGSDQHLAAHVRVGVELVKDQHLTGVAAGRDSYPCECTGLGCAREGQARGSGNAASHHSTAGQGALVVGEAHLARGHHWLEVRVPRVAEHRAVHFLNGEPEDVVRVTDSRCGAKPLTHADVGLAGNAKDLSALVAEALTVVDRPAHVSAKPPLAQGSAHSRRGCLARGRLSGMERKCH